MKIKIYFIVFIIIVLSNVILSQSSIEEKMYVSLNSYPCTRIMTLNGQIGCSSSHGGDSGILYLIDSDESYNNYFSYNQQKDIIIVFDSNYFNKTLLSTLYTKKKMNGALILTDVEKTYPYSPELQYPIKQYGLYPDSSLVWNPNGDGFTYQSFPFPMFALELETSSYIRNLSTINRNGKYPAYGAELDSFMQGAINAETCLRRGFCEPVGGQSIWSSFSAEIDQSKPIILVMLPLDTTAFFRDLATGTDQSAYALVVLLSILNSLQGVDKTKWDKEVIFAMWNSERWGYVGSTNFVNDLLNFNCTSLNSDNENSCSSPPILDLTFEQIKFENIYAIIEFNQLGRPIKSGIKTPNDSDIYNLVFHPNGGADQLMNVFTQSAQSFENSTIQFKTTTQKELPPCSSMSFIKEINKKSAPNFIGTLVITDHDYQYNNQYFGYEQDNAGNIDTTRSTLIDMIQVFSTSIDLLAGGNGTVKVDDFFVRDIYSCLTSSFTCSWVTSLMSTYPYNPIPNFYSSVYGVSPVNHISSIETRFVYKLATYLTQHRTNATNCTYDSDCDTASSICVSKVCIYSNTHFHDAISLAFSFDNSKSSWTIVNSSYPVFVESNWDYTTVRLFHVGSYTNEIWFLVSGLIELLLSVGIIFYIKKYLSKRYKLL
ncbi:hypothetical protein RB653_008276 [Dictyostelium firmibasis]|uniref:Nicastrin n=1 Tax=Dictyostelium firmibasis TaxID=79012 RepID=A0AAN7TSC1_9MYCE